MPSYNGELFFKLYITKFICRISSIWLTNSLRKQAYIKYSSNWILIFYNSLRFFITHAMPWHKYGNDVVNHHMADTKKIQAQTQDAFSAFPSMNPPADGLHHKWYPLKQQAPGAQRMSHLRGFRQGYRWRYKLKERIFKNEEPPSPQQQPLRP